MPIIFFAERTTPKAVVSGRTRCALRMRSGRRRRCIQQTSRWVNCWFCAASLTTSFATPRPTGSIRAEIYGKSLSAAVPAGDEPCCLIAPSRSSVSVREERQVFDRQVDALRGRG